MLTFLVLGLMVCAVSVGNAAPMGTAWTYQGRLMDINSPADGPYDFEFKLFDDPCTSKQIGSTIDINDLDVIDGYFTTILDFGSDVFNGYARWLEISVRPGNSTERPTILEPRQEVTPTPYAIFSSNADTLDLLDSTAFASRVHNHDSVYAAISHSHDGVYALVSHIHDDRYYTKSQLQVSGSASVHWDNLRSVPTGFADGVDNVGAGDTDWTESGGNVYRETGYVGIGTTNPSQKLEVGNISDNFNYLRLGAANYTGVMFYDGEGTNSGLIQYDHTSDMMKFSTRPAGSNPTEKMRITSDGKVGIGTSSPGEKLVVDGCIDSSESYKLDGNTVVSNSGKWNIFVGEEAGADLSTGMYNSALGYQALTNITQGDKNSAVGYVALASTTHGSENSAVGYYSLARNDFGSGNSAIGSYAMWGNTMGHYNSAIGCQALYNNIEGSYNSAIGCQALYNNTTGKHNIGIGYKANYYNQEGSENTIIGYEAGRGSNYLNKSGNVFIGYKAGYWENGSNKLYIANGPDDSNTLIYGDFSDGHVAIGTTDPVNILHLHSALGNPVLRMSGSNYPGINGAYIRMVNSDGSLRLTAANGLDDLTITSTGNVGIGAYTPNAELEVNGEIRISPDSESKLRIGRYSVTYPYSYITAIGGVDQIRLQIDAGTKMVIGSDGNVGIGTTSPAGMLDVNGSIYQRGSELHADYVFEPGYELESIDEHSEFMWNEKHLPAIPKAELDENGREILEVGAHRRGIVEELEKAHIYIEQLHKQNKELETRLVKLEALVAHLNVSLEGGIK
jgi:hypothetical protein